MQDIFLGDADDAIGWVAWADAPTPTDRSMGPRASNVGMRKSVECLRTALRTDQCSQVVLVAG